MWWKFIIMFIINFMSTLEFIATSLLRSRFTLFTGIRFQMSRCLTVLKTEEYQFLFHHAQNQTSDVFMKHLDDG